MDKPFIDEQGRLVLPEALQEWLRSQRGPLSIYIQLEPGESHWHVEGFRVSSDPLQFVPLRPRLDELSEQTRITESTEPEVSADTPKQARLKIVDGIPLFYDTVADEDIAEAVREMREE